MTYIYKDITKKSVEVIRTNGKKFTRKKTKIEMWALENGFNYAYIAQALGITDHNQYNKIMTSPKGLTVNQIVNLVHICDKTVTDIFFSTFIDTDIKELSESEISYVLKIQRF